ncbi:MAG TPA: hypothetical protein VLA40_10265, partial [Rheinheimera sp.]|nr:hypothetical protein [Rheinheimera sp.]
MSERDIVQAFLLKCRGSANSFMLPDFGAYELPSGISSAFTDVLSNTGYVWSTAGSSDQYINSEYLASSAIDRHVTADNELLCSWRRYYSVFGIRRWPLANNALGINTHTAYIQRIKFTQNPEGRATQVLLAVGSGDSYFLQRGYCGNAYPTSSGVLSMPFITGNEVTSNNIGIVFAAGTDGRQNMKWRAYDYHISRCALVANSENLLKSSSIFDTDWTATRASVTSGYDAGDPVFGIRSGAWALFGNSDVNTTHYAAQGVTKPTTEDLYTFSIYAKAKERTEIKMLLQTPNNNYNQAVFWLASGTAQLLNDQGNASRGSAKIYDISSGWYRCAITGLTTSHSTVTGVIYPTSGTGTQYTNNGSDGVLIYGGQLNRHPFVTPHVPTSDTVVVGSGN